MPRAKRHYIPGHIWHITHRCHKREYLLKFARDRNRWLKWLLDAKKRYGLVILNYTVSSNHIHLLVADGGDRYAISKSMQLIAGRMAQEYNKRKRRKGAFWEDRYHATAVENGEYLLRCIVYIDLNMSRAGIAGHSAQWSYSGYNEIQQPRRKSSLIAYERLRVLAGFNSYGEFQDSHRDWVSAALDNGRNTRESMWTQSIAVGSKEFVERTKGKFVISAQGRKAVDSGDIFQLRDPAVPYNLDFGTKNNAIPAENGYLWN